MQSIRFLSSGFLIITFGIVSSSMAALEAGITVKQKEEINTRKKQIIYSRNETLRSAQEKTERGRRPPVKTITCKNVHHTGKAGLRDNLWRAWNREASNAAQRFNRDQAIRRAREALNGIRKDPIPRWPGISRQEQLDAMIDRARQKARERQRGSGAVIYQVKPSKKQEGVDQFLRRFNEATYVKNN